MSSDLLIYGSTGFVGSAIAAQAVTSGMRPILAARNEAAVRRQAHDLKLDYRVFGLEDSTAMDAALADAAVVLHCAGPYLYTYKPMVEGCLRTGRHYLDLTGEFPVYQAMAELDGQARAKGIMLMSGVGFDVVPTDCLAVHLKQQLPSATHLTLAFQTIGPAGLPPGTQRTMIEMLPYGDFVRRHGRLEPPGNRLKTRLVDFGQGPKIVTRLTWGDIFTAYHSTGIPNIEDFIALSPAMRRQMALLGRLRPLFRSAVVRRWVKRFVKPGPTAEDCRKTVTHVYGEVEDDNGRKAAARLHGPEAGVVWTTATALAAARKVLEGRSPPGFQTPAMAYGADLVLEIEGVVREDIG